MHVLSCVTLDHHVFFFIFITVKPIQPTISTSPAGTEIADGGNVTLSCDYGGTDTSGQTVAYVWNKGSGVVNAETAATLSLTSVGWDAAAAYSCSITVDSTSSNTSAETTLTGRLTFNITKT